MRFSRTRSSRAFEYPPSRIVLRRILLAIAGPLGKRRGKQRDPERGGLYLALDTIRTSM